MSTPHTHDGVDVAAFYQSIDHFDSEAFGAFFAEDATYVFSSHPGVHAMDVTPLSPPRRRSGRPSSRSGTSSST